LDRIPTVLTVALTGLAFACAVICAFPDAADADAAQVTVVDPSGSQQTLSVDALAGSEDVTARTYTLRSAGGESAQAVTGFSLAAILEAAGADPYGFTYLEAQRPAGGSLLLSRHQALDPGAFADGPPVIYATGTGTGFLRPSSGPGDLNGADCFEAPQGITLVLRKGEPLQVRAKASTLRTRPGKAVSFTAVVDRAGSGEQLSYSWYFDDGNSASGASTRHSFAKRGSYDVVVGVTTPGDGAGASAVVTVQVGPPLSGPVRKGGGRDHDAEAPDHGAASGTPGAATPSSGTGSSGTTTTPHPSSATTHDAREQRPASEPPAGERVSGLLLTSAEIPPPEPTAAPTARTGKLDGSGGGGLPDAALGLLVTAGLLGLGALTETRNLLR
jgi:hypothetical protein